MSPQSYFYIRAAIILVGVAACGAWLGKSLGQRLWQSYRERAERLQIANEQMQADLRQTELCLQEAQELQLPKTV